MVRKISSFFLILLLLPICSQKCQGALLLAQGPYHQENLGVLIESTTLEHRLQFHLPKINQNHLVLYYVPINFSQHPFQVLDINLDNGQSRITDAVLGRPGPNATLLHSNGLLYIGSGGPAHLMAYDPASGKTQEIGKSADNGVQYMVEGDDGAVYLGECVKGYIERYDPKTGSWENYGIMDDPGPPYYRYAYTLGADGRYVYVAIGQNPWYLVIFDRVEKKQRIFWKDLKPHNVAVSRGRNGGWFAQLIDAQGKKSYYRLHGGQPEPLKLAPLTAPANVPLGYNPPKNYELDLTKALPDSAIKGQVTVRWRTLGATSWQEASAQVRVSPMDIKRLYAGPDSILFGFTSFYGPVFTYDLGKRLLTILGRPQRSLYDALLFQEKWFLAGYAGVTMIYDPKRPWNLTGSGENLQDPLRNPHLLKIAPQGSAKYHYYLTLGADGFVYIGGHHERSGVGGSLGWYQPKTGLTGGLRGPFSKHSVSDLIPAEAGSKIIFSSYNVEKGLDGKIFIFDVPQKKLAGDFVPLPGVNDTGKILEVAPGVVIGVVAKTPNSIIYKADLKQRQIIWKKEVAGLAFGSVRGFDRRLIKGPDDHIWLYLNNTICRINPADGNLQEVFAAPPAGNLLFVGHDLYIYGGTVLRKVSGLFQNNSEN